MAEAYKQQHTSQQRRQPRETAPAPLHQCCTVGQECLCSLLTVDLPMCLCMSQCTLHMTLQYPACWLLLTVPAMHVCCLPADKAMYEPLTPWCMFSARLAKVCSGARVRVRLCTCIRLATTGTLRVQLWPCWHGGQLPHTFALFVSMCVLTTWQCCHVWGAVPKPNL